MQRGPNLCRFPPEPLRIASSGPGKRAEGYFVGLGGAALAREPLLPIQPRSLARTNTKIAKITAMSRQMATINKPSRLPIRRGESPPATPRTASRSITAQITSNSIGFSFSFMSSFPSRRRATPVPSEGLGKTCSVNRRPHLSPAGSKQTGAVPQTSGAAITGKTCRREATPTATANAARWHA